MDWFILLLCLTAVALAFLIWRRFSSANKNWIVVDGSNVLHWDRETPNLQSVIEVVRILESEGFKPVVWFDANAGYLVWDKYTGPKTFAHWLGLPERHVFVAPKGTPADPLLLKRAEKLKARVVTNDRFRDWEDRFPAIREQGFLVRGYIKGDVIGLDLILEEAGS